MDALYVRTLEIMETWLTTIERLVPKPIAVPFAKSFVFRYVEQTLEQALVQKLARVITGLHSARLLLNNGFFQEQASIQRMVDDFDEDITFLAYGLLCDKFTERHKEFLGAFYEEEFDNPDSALDSTQKRLAVPRDKIRAYIANLGASLAAQDAGDDPMRTKGSMDPEGLLADPSGGVKNARTLSKLYSGFLHGASPQIMNMFGGDPPRFQVSGMLGTPHENDHREDLWNQFYRALICFNLVALILRNQDLIKSVTDYRAEFDQVTDKEDM